MTKSLLTFILPVISTGLFFSIQFFIDTNNLPKGYELAKVSGLYFNTCLVLICSLILVAYNVGFSIAGKSRVLILVVLSYFCMSLATYFAFDRELAIGGSQFRQAGFLSYTFLYIVFCYFFLWDWEEKTIALILDTAIVLGFIQSIIGFIDLFKSRSVNDLASGEFIRGSFGQSNFFAAQVLGVAVLSLYLGLNFPAAKIKKCFYFISFLFSSIILLISMSRGAVACYIFLLLVIFISNKSIFISRFLKNINKKSLVLISTLSFAILLLLLTYYYEPSRHLFWDDAFKLIRQRPLLGFGADNIHVAYENSGLVNGRFIDRTHNNILDLIVSFGLLYFGVHIVIVVVALRQILKKPQTTLIFSLCLPILAYLLTGLVQTKSVYHHLEFAIFSGILLAQLFSKKSRNSFIAV